MPVPHDSDRLSVNALAEDEPLGVLISGGLDSCILTAWLLEQHRTVQPFYVRSDLCWQREEQQAAERFLQKVQSSRLSKLVTLKMPMADLYRDHWSVTCRGAPPAGSPDDAVYLPGRNALLLIKPVVWCQMHGIRALAIGPLSTNPFADTTEAFYASFQRTVNLPGTLAVSLLTPLAGMTKQDVMRLGREFPLHLTFSCIAPVNGRHCGRCNKCAERQQAFQFAGLPDHCVYADGARVQSPA